MASIDSIGYELLYIFHSNILTFGLDRLDYLVGVVLLFLFVYVHFMNFLFLVASSTVSDQY